MIGWKFVWRRFGPDMLYFATKFIWFFRPFSSDFRTESQLWLLRGIASATYVQLKRSIFSVILRKISEQKEINIFQLFFLIFFVDNPIVISCVYLYMPRQCLEYLWNSRYKNLLFEIVKRWTNDHWWWQ